MSGAEHAGGDASAVEAVVGTDASPINAVEPQGEKKAGEVNHTKEPGVFDKWADQELEEKSGKGFHHRKHFNTKRNYDNVKTDFTSLPETDDPDEIRQQVEFYFRDSNLVQDRFLFNLVAGTKNEWVDIKIIHNFKRMLRFQPYSAVVNALKESDILEVNDKDQIRRKTALPDEVGAKFDDSRNAAIADFEDRSIPRSIYAKGFGDEGPSTQFDIEAFFAPYGPINAVRLRRMTNRQFKGSVFVEFDGVETQKAFLALDPKPKYHGNELLIMSKKTYCDQKIELIKAGKIKPNERYDNKPRGGGRGGRGRGGNRGRGKFDRRDRRDDDRGRRDRYDDDDRDWNGRRKNFQASEEFAEAQYGGHGYEPAEAKKRARYDDDDQAQDGAGPKKAKVDDAA